ncbi:MAG: DegV family protein [Lachnospiraceae bacterium]|nr:DegV family protein [Lachnospiraceae bacterium]
MSFTIVTDTGANITDKVRDHYRIEVVPLTLIMDGEELQFTSTEDFDYDGYYEKLKEGMKATTSQVNPAQFTQCFEKILEKGEDVLYIGLSGGVTGSIGSAKIAASDLSEEFPERQIRIVDSLGASLGEGILVIEAAKCRDKGMSLEEVADHIDFQKYCMYQVFVVDDLKHLKRTGRISGALASLGTMMDLKPILKGDTEGKIVVECKARGRKQAIRALAEKYRDMVVDPEEQIVGISYGGHREDAVHLANMIKKIAEPKSIWMVAHEPVTGAHVGPGMLALYFRGADDVRAF